MNPETRKTFAAMVEFNRLMAAAEFRRQEAARPRSNRFWSTFVQYEREINRIGQEIRAARGEA